MVVVVAVEAACGGGEGGGGGENTSAASRPTLQHGAIGARWLGAAVISVATRLMRKRRFAEVSKTRQKLPDTSARGQKINDTSEAFPRSRAARRRCRLSNSRSADGPKGGEWRRVAAWERVSGRRAGGEGNEAPISVLL
jgi:hypothetical protein